MINQTIVSLGGAYVERVSNPPDVHNLQTSRSVGGGVSNGCESNERNVGRYGTSNNNGRNRGIRPRCQRSDSSQCSCKNDCSEWKFVFFFINRIRCRNLCAIRLFLYSKRKSDDCQHNRTRYYFELSHKLVWNPSAIILLNSESGVVA